LVLAVLAAKIKLPKSPKLALLTSLASYKNPCCKIRIQNAKIGKLAGMTKWGDRSKLPGF